MKISFIYPDLHSSEFIDSLDLINERIGKDNMRLFMPDIILKTIHIALLLLWTIIFKRYFFWITRYVTAKDLGAIVTGLLLYLVLAVLSLQLIFFGMKKFRPVFLHFIKTRDAEESFSFSNYVERKDGNKKALDELDFFKMCDILKDSKITDATAICDGSLCRVEVAYENESSSDVFTFFLPYHENAGLDKVVVDFSRKCVIFPEEANTNEETS